VVFPSGAPVSLPFGIYRALLGSILCGFSASHDRELWPPSVRRDVPGQFPSELRHLAALRQPCARRFCHSLRLGRHAPQKHVPWLATPDHFD
jgi:hypothetical protein